MLVISHALFSQFWVEEEVAAAVEFQHLLFRYTALETDLRAWVVLESERESKVVWGA